MRARSWLVAMCVIAAWSACSGPSAGGNNGGGDDGGGAVRENCNTPGDEDGNGLADCRDPACATAPGCQGVCGNGELEAGEQCDDGNTRDGDACEHDCTLPACGNGILDPGEQCDDGNLVSGDACE